MKNKINRFFHGFKEYIIYNKLFCYYSILSTICCILIRFNTNGSLFSFHPLIFDISIPIIFGSLTYLIKNKKEYTYLLICLIILSIICIINNIYYEFYSSYASFSLITALKQVGEVGDALIEKIRLVQFIYLLAPIIFIIINHYLSKTEDIKVLIKKKDNKYSFKQTLFIGLAITAIGTLSLNIVDFNRLAKQWNREIVVNRFGIIIYQINDLFNTLRPTIDSWFGYDVALKRFNDYYNENTIKKSNNEYTNIFKDYNIIFIHMESITDFLIDLKINDVPIAPNITKLSEEGIYFSNFYPQISAGTSSDTEFTLSTSLMPAISGTVFVSYSNREYPSIQKELTSKGYYTFSMHANKALMWNRNNMHPSLGYKDFYSSNSYNIDEIVGLGLSDKSFFNQSIPILETIESQNNKYMGTIITLSNHTPFDNNELFEQIDLTYTINDKDETINYSYLENTKLGDYIRSSHYADEALGLFIDNIKNSEYFNNTIFVLYGDHDPKLAINEYSNYYNFDFTTGKIYEKEDDNYINYDYYANELNKKTPLIIWSKNQEFHKKIDYYMGMIDVYPTLANMLGLYNKYALGHDIFEIKDDNIVAFPNGNFLTNKVYYHNSKQEYKTISGDEILSDDYIDNCKKYTDTVIEISDGIITHDLIKASSNKETEEIK